MLWSLPSNKVSKGTDIFFSLKLFTVHTNTSRKYEHPSSNGSPAYLEQTDK